MSLRGSELVSSSDGLVTGLLFLDWKKAVGCHDSTAAVEVL